MIKNLIPNISTFENNSKKVKIDYERIIEEKNKIVSARKIKFNRTAINL